MTREEVVAEAERRQASDRDASWIAASRDGEWTVVGIVKPELSHLGPAVNQAARSRGSILSSRSGIWGGTPLGGI